MAGVATDAALERLTKLLTAYGVAVRAGCLTPCMEDEESFRSMFGLSEMSKYVVEAWKKSNYARAPVTLAPTSATSVSNSAPKTTAPAEDADQKEEIP